MASFLNVESTTLSPSVVGSLGIFQNLQRSADLIITRPSLVIRIIDLDELGVKVRPSRQTIAFVQFPESLE